MICMYTLCAFTCSLLLPTEVHAYLALRGLKRRQNDNYFDKRVFGDFGVHSVLQCQNAHSTQVNVDWTCQTTCSFKMQST